MRVICAGCQADLGRPERVGRRDTCPRCRGDLHACRQCRFYDPRAADRCREPQAERVLDPTRANFCEYFGIADAAAAPVCAAGHSAVRTARDADARTALERLFKR